MRSGQSVFEEAERNDAEIQKKMEARKNGWVQDFFITMDEAKKDKVKPLIVLDAQLGLCGFYEHSIMEGKKFVGTEICVKDWATCPICAKDNNPSFVIKLSVLDITPYEIQNGERKGTIIPFTRKMITIKPRQRAKWRDIEQNCIKQNGTFRGCYLEMRRDKSDPNSASIGEPQQIEVKVDVGGQERLFFQSFDFIPEAELVANFSTPEKMGQKNEVLEIANLHITPFDYGKVFPEPDLDDLIKRFGDSSLGSAHSVAKEWEQQSTGQPAAPTNADAMRSRLRGSQPAQPAQQAALPPARTAEQEFEQAPQGTQGAPVVPQVAEGDDNIPFG
jgi:hypothetical protein